MIETANALRAVLTSPFFLGGWVLLVAASLALLVRDMRYRNPEIMPLMRVVWLFTVAYSGPFGLWVYWVSGRKQISHDSLPRRGWRSTAHCYSGCGFGEITGVVVTVGLLSLNNWWVAGITFALAYVFGYALTVGPLVQEGVPFGQALWDAFLSETASIAVMEVVAIGTDLWLAGDATMGDPLFWSSLVFSLTAGLLAAFPVNLLLIRFGVKEGMHDPREMAEHAAA